MRQFDGVKLTGTLLIYQLSFFSSHKSDLNLWPQNYIYVMK